MSATDPDQLRKLAKDLLREHRAGVPEARRRLEGRAEPVKLADAQFVIAREHGFPSWPKLQAYVTRVREHGPEIRHAFEDGVDYYADRADGLLASADDGTPGALGVFARWGARRGARRDARTVVAREHGFPDWPALVRHVRALPTSGEPFYRAWQAVRAQDVDALAAQLDRFPELARASGTNGNDLLGLAAATRDERLVALLLERGADVDRGNSHGWTALHQAAYLNLPHMVRTLLDAGASTTISARGDGGTPMVVALFWGHRDVARSVAGPPRNLRAAAGLDDVDLIDDLLGSPDGRAGAHRAFYRPHGGFPSWRPSDDPAEVLAEAVSWAARNDSVRALGALAAHGADLDADVYRGTPLTWAAFTGATAAVRRLLELGADPDRRGTFGGPEHGEGVTALHLAAQNGDADVIRALLDGGADRTIEDGLHGGTPKDWAAHEGRAAAAALLT